MDYFEYRDGKLFCEDVPVKAIAKKVGTPFYLYSYATFARHFNVFDGAFGQMPHIVCYSLKANPNGALLRIIAGSGRRGGYRVRRRAFPGLECRDTCR